MVHETVIRPFEDVLLAMFIYLLHRSKLQLRQEEMPGLFKVAQSLDDMQPLEWVGPVATWQIPLSGSFQWK